MATLDKVLVIKVLTTSYLLPSGAGKEFCNILTAINKVTSSEVVEVRFRVTFNLTQWIEIVKTGATFTITASGGETESLTQSQINLFISYCRSTPEQLNCGCI